MVPEYEPDYAPKYLAACAVKTYSMYLRLSGLLQPPYFKPFSKLLNYNNNRNTQKYAVLFRGIIGYILETNN